jgi:hypothetical protein
MSGKRWESLTQSYKRNSMVKGFSYGSQGVNDFQTSVVPRIACLLRWLRILISIRNASLQNTGSIFYRPSFTETDAPRDRWKLIAKRAKEAGAILRRHPVNLSVFEFGLRVLVQSRRRG